MLVHVGFSILSLQVGGQLGQGLSGLVSLLGQTSHHSNSRVLLVQRRAELRFGFLQLLAQRKHLLRGRIPLVLERLQQRRDGCVLWRLGPGGRVGVDWQQIFDRQLFAVDGIFAVFLDVRFDEPALEDVAGLGRQHGFLRGFSGNRADHSVVDADAERTWIDSGDNSRWLAVWMCVRFAGTTF